MKITSKIFAGVFAAAVMTSAAVATVSADDYVANVPVLTAKSFSADSFTEATSEKVLAAVNASKEMIKLTIDGDTLGTNFKSQFAVMALQSAGKDLKLTATSDRTYTIEANKAELAKIDASSSTKGFNFGLTIRDLTDKVNIAYGSELKEIAAGSLYLKPAADGTFPLTYKVTIDYNMGGKDNKDTYHCYSVADNGTIKDCTDSVDFNKEKSTVSFNLGHSSYYLITKTDLKITEKGSTGEAPKDTQDPTNSSKPAGSTTNPDTGVALPIALVALAGGSVAVSAIVAKKRK
ncbi:MAG: hypothetical protein J1F04_08655 [Oscillospiraceae bacterium]|nr:hypothetical protein [Oscillospiraceae bacterium]